MKTKSIVLGAIIALGLIAAGWVYLYWDKAVPIAAMVRFAPASRSSAYVATKPAKPATRVAIRKASNENPKGKQKMGAVQNLEK